MGRRRRGGGRGSNNQQIQRHLNNGAVTPSQEEGDDQNPEESMMSMETSGEIDVESSRSDDDDEGDEEDVPQPETALVRSSHCTGRGGGAGARRGKRVVNITQQPRSYGGEGLGDLQSVVDGIQETMRGLVQCAGCSVDGFKTMDDTPENRNEKNSMLKRYRDAAVALTETQEKLKVLPSAAVAAFDELELGTLGEGVEDDEQFFAKLDQYAEAAREEGIKRCELIGMKQVNKNGMYQYFLEEINKLDRAPRKSVGAEEADDEIPTASNQRGSKKTGTAQQPDENCFSEGLQLLTEYIPTSDPITRKPLKNPVVNRKCNHVYENDSITGMLVSAGTRGTRCPYAGCYNKSPITMEDLYKDPVLARKIAEKIKEGSYE